MATLFSDDFNRADAATLGSPWLGANSQIISNKARLNGSGANLDGLSVPGSSANYEVQATLTQGELVSGGARGLGLLARYTGTTSFYLLWCDEYGTNFRLYNVDGGFTEIATAWSPGSALSDPITLKLSCNGTAIKGYVNGVERLSATSSTHTAVGMAGMRTFNADTMPSHRWEDFSIVDFAGAGPTYTRSLSGTQGAASGTLASAKLQKFHLLNSVASGSNHGALQTGGSPPSTATTGTGWTVGNEPAGDQASLDWGSEVARTTFTATAMPASTINNTIGDSIRTDALTGTFAAGSWALSIVLRAVTAGGSFDGFIKARMWRGTDATGSGATEVGALTSGTTVTNVATSTDHTSVVTWPSVGQLVLNNEYLFFQIALQVTGAGSTTTQDALIRVGASGVLGTPFTPPAPRSLDGTQPSATGALTRVAGRVRGLTGAQEAATGVLTRPVPGTRSLAGAQDAPSGALTRVHVTRGRSLVGTQDPPSGALARAWPGAPPAQALQLSNTGMAVYSAWAHDTTQPLTIAFWCRLDSGSQGHGNLATITNDTFTSEVGFWVPDHRPRVYQGSVMIANVQTDVLPPIVNYGEWHHVVFSRDDPSGIFRVYLDCVPYPNATGTTPDPNGILADVNYLVVGAAPAGHHFNGALSQFRVWLRTLSQAELMAERASPTAVVTTDLFGDWKFDGAVTDASAGAHHMTALGVPVGGTITYVSVGEFVFPAGTQPPASGSLTALKLRSLAGAQPSGTGALSRLKALARPLAGAQLAASAVLTRLKALLRPLTGLQGIPTATLTRLHTARGRALTGAQDAPSGTLAAVTTGGGGPTYARSLAGTQLAASGALTRRASKLRGLAGEQGVPTATLTRRAALKRVLAGLGGIPSGVLLRTLAVNRSLAGLQDRPSGTLTRLRVRTFAGAQPAGTGSLAGSRVFLRTLAGAQGQPFGVLLVLYPVPHPIVTMAPIGIAYVTSSAPRSGSATHTEESVPQTGVAVSV